MKQTYFSVWGVWLLPLDLRYSSLDDLRNWAKREGLAGKERFVAQGVLKELRRLYPGHMRVGVLVHLYRDPVGRLSYEERPFVSVAALIGRNEEYRILRFQLRYTEGDRDAGRVLFNFSSPEMPGVEAISSVSFSKRICDKFFRMFETLEEQGYDVSRSFDVRPDLKRILISEEVFDVDVSADLRADFSRDSKNKRIHDVEFRLFPDLIPARVESPEGANPPEEALRKLIEEFLSPYRRFFDLYQGTADGFLAVLELLVRHGGCPSVVTTMLNRDSETSDICNFREILKKVTLLEHSVNVARMMLKRLKETYYGRDYENLIPKVFIVSFAHDLGKLPSLRANPVYPDLDHPLISAQKLEEIFCSKTAPPWFPDALNLIRRHHGSFSKDSSIPLRWADLRAREIEIGAYGNGLKVTEWEEWFDMKRFLEILRPKVNMIQGTRRFNAFSLGSLVYCQPNFLYESAAKLASEKKVIDLRLHIIAEKERALIRIVQSLREAGILSEFIGESFIGRTYKVQAEIFKSRMFLIPLKIEFFGSPGRIERRKEGYLQLIRKVTPAEKIYP